MEPSRNKLGSMYIRHLGFQLVYVDCCASVALYNDMSSTAASGIDHASAWRSRCGGRAPREDIVQKSLICLALWYHCGAWVVSLWCQTRST
eukprot:6486681-Amphidinium_carterae.1